MKRIARVLVAASFLAACGSSAETPAPSPPTPTPSAALLDQAGALEDGDARSSGSAYDRYDVQVAAGDHLRISVTSAAFDPTLEVTPPRGAPLINDDFAGDRTRSQIELVATVAGPLKVQVSSYQPDARGAYQVRVERVTDAAPRVAAAPPAAGTRRHHQLGSVLSSVRLGAPAAPAGSATPPGTAPAPGAGTPATRVALGDRTQADLSPSDTRLPSGESADVYVLSLATATPLTIRMESRAVDSFLMVTTPDGQTLENDDGGGGLDSQVQIPSAAPGEYRIVCTSYRAGETGAYELKVMGPRDAASPAAVAVAAGAEVVQRGELAAGDAQLRSGEFKDEYTFDWAPGTAVHLEARSTEFDTYLILRTPSGEQRDNDDQSPGVLNAGMDFVAQEAGTYRVIVTSYRPGETGHYELGVRAAGTAAPGAGGAPAAAPAPAAPAAPVAAGADQTFTGSLAAGDATLSSGEFSDTYQMQFTPGSPVSIRLESSQFDTYLIVRSPSGRQDDNDDVSPGVLNSGIDIPSAEAGSYTVVVTSYRPGEAGAYRLTASAGSGGAAPAATPGPGTAPGPGGGTSPSGPAAPAIAGQRVWVLSVGISDYPGSGNDLPECANDAVKIAEALRRQGLTTPEREFLLTDAGATRGAIRQAMQRITSQIGADDVFVFFYSGHGGQRTARSTDVRELDGIDEYLYVYDGELLDDELGTMMDGVRARTTLAAIDACFAGGFAKDIVTRPGIVGMFSSEEDITSAVASQFQAGGYLSHFLRLGIQGDADSDPRDRALTVGELTHFVWQQYAAHASDVRMGTGYQHLVVDRGAVHTTQMLWRTAR